MGKVVASTNNAQISKGEALKLERENKKKIVAKFEATKKAGQISEGGLFVQFRTVKEVNAEMVKIDKNGIVDYTNEVINFLVKKDSNFKSPVAFLGGLKVNEAFKLVQNGLKYNSSLIHNLIERAFINLAHNGVNLQAVNQYAEAGAKMNTLLMQAVKERNNVNILALFGAFSKSQTETKFLNVATGGLLLEFAPSLFLSKGLDLKTVESDVKAKETHKNKFLPSIKFEGKESKFLESSIFASFTELAKANEALEIKANEALESFEIRFMTFSAKQNEALVKVAKANEAQKPTKVVKIEAVKASPKASEAVKA